jgi:PilZ domain-containing protein
MSNQRDAFGSNSPMEEGVSNTAEYLRALKQNNVNDQPAGTASAPTPRSQPPASERRKNQRFKCEGSAEFRSEGSDIRTWATITDLSRGGCYVEMQATSPRDTSVNMVLDVNGVRVQMKGVVRVSYPFLGMGIAFTEVTAENRTRLDEILTRIAGQVVQPISGAPAVGVNGLDISHVRDASAALKAVAAFFQTNPALTREEFTELIFESQR